MRPEVGSSHATSVKAKARESTILEYAQSTLLRGFAATVGSQMVAPSERSGKFNTATE